MPFAHEKSPAGFQQSRHDLRPCGDGRDLAQRSNTSEDQIETPRRQHAQSIVHRSFDEAQLLAAAGRCPRGESARFDQRIGREV